MSIFLYFVIIGLVGLAFMAIPGLGRHGHGGAHGVGHAGHGLNLGHGTGHAGHISAGHAGGHVAHTGAGHAAGHHAGTHGHTGAQGKETLPADAPGMLRLIPSPRMIFSLLALYGAFGYALQPHVDTLLAACLALPPAACIERFLVTPFWNMMFKLEGKTNSPMESLVLCEAEAVTPFRNGKGVIAVEKDGRLVQLSARLPEDQANLAIQVGDKLRIEEVDAANERVTVTLH